MILEYAPCAVLHEVLDERWSSRRRMLINRYRNTSSSEEPRVDVARIQIGNERKRNNRIERIYYGRQNCTNDGCRRHVHHVLVGSLIIDMDDSVERIPRFVSAFFIVSVRSDPNRSEKSLKSGLYLQKPSVLCRVEDSGNSLTNDVLPVNHDRFKSFPLPQRR